MMLRPGWVLERYLGWSLRLEQPGLKILERRYGPLVKWLVLVDGGVESELESSARTLRLRSPRSQIVMNDFRGTHDGARRLAGCRLLPVRTGRWFGVGTFLIDLSTHADELWRRVAARERGKCRAAGRAGVTVTCTRRPTPAALDGFLRLHRAMATERDLDQAPGPALRRMAADDRLLFVACRDESGRDLVANVVYLGDGDAFFLYGAGAATVPPGAGHLAHWETIVTLQREGYRRYDLGQVPSRDPGDGIYRFKRSFGGAFVDFGREYQWRSPAWRLAYAITRPKPRRRPKATA